MEKSAGHMYFENDHEYFTDGLAVYRAHVSEPLQEGPDGPVREGAWYCSVREWEKEAYNYDEEITNGLARSDS